MSMQDLIQKSEADFARNWRPPQPVGQAAPADTTPLWQAVTASRGAPPNLVAKSQAQQRRSVMPQQAQQAQITRSQAQAAYNALPPVFPVQRGGYATPQGWVEESWAYTPHDAVQIQHGLARPGTAADLQQQQPAQQAQPKKAAVKTGIVTKSFSGSAYNGNAVYKAAVAFNKSRGRYLKEPYGK